MTAWTASLSGWGRYPVRDCTLWQPTTAQALHETLAPLPTCIARGNGRSYGDASLNPEATIDLRRLDRLIAFDEATGAMQCEAGVLLSDLDGGLGGPAAAAVAGGGAPRRAPGGGAADPPSRRCAAAARAMSGIAAARIEAER